MTKEEILQQYIKFVRKFKAYPKRNDFKDFAGVSRDVVEKRYPGGFAALKTAALATGELQDIILDVSSLSDDYRISVEKILKKYKRFIITTAVANSPVNTKFLSALRTYCKHEDAALIILPSIMRGNDEKWTIDPELRNECIITSDYKFNSNVGVLGIANNSKSTDPISGLPRLGKRNGSFICASPKQNMKVVPTGISKLPHIMMSTGAVTKPNYTKGMFMQSKQDLLADNDHVTGAVIVELDTNELFHIRPVNADRSGGFADLGSYYAEGKKSAYAPEALVSGDWHVGETDQVVVKSKLELLSRLKINKLIVHDLFDGKSLNPHEREKLLLLAKRAQKGELDLDKELEMVARDLKIMGTATKEVVIVPSNHDEFLNRYLEAGEYVKHPYNHKAALRLAMDMLEDKNPLEEEMRRRGIKNNVKFLVRDESFKVGGVEVGQHGDRGQNGARASLKGLEESYGACIVGHGHSPKMERSAWMVGTSTHMNLGYNVGASSWLNTDALVYPNGNRQLLNYIQGRFTTRKL